jgi:hypothetical protein
MFVKRNLINLTLLFSFSIACNRDLHEAPDKGAEPSAVAVEQQALAPRPCNRIWVQASKNAGTRQGAYTRTVRDGDDQCDAEQPGCVVNEGHIQCRYGVSGRFWSCYGNVRWQGLLVEFCRNGPRGGVACGDGLCDDIALVSTTTTSTMTTSTSTESCSSCSGDCGACAVCGDSYCNYEGGESCESCSSDCGSCPVCGDSYCDMGEDCSTCADCCPICGDGYCDGGEDCSSCSADCCPICGDELCEYPEDCMSCGDDCCP